LTNVMPTDQGTFDALVTSVTDGIEDARQSLEDCVTTYNEKRDDISVWEQFLDWFMQRMNEVRELLEKALAKFTEFLATIADYLSPGNPFAMYAKQDIWISVKQKITGSRTTISPGYLKADTTWKGDPGDHYSDLASRQDTAIATVAGYTDGMIDFLGDYAQKILDAWIDFGERLLTYVVDQVSAASEFVSADPLKWLDIVPKIVTLCTNVAQLGIDTTSAFAKNFTESKATADQLKQDMADLYGFPDGTWPAATLG
jgi:hypothetical protein